MEYDFVNGEDTSFNATSVVCAIFTLAKIYYNYQSVGPSEQYN